MQLKLKGISQEQNEQQEASFLKEHAHKFITEANQEQANQKPKVACITFY